MNENMRLAQVLLPSGNVCCKMEEQYLPFLHLANLMQDVCRFPTTQLIITALLCDLYYSSMLDS
jgi:hypothetical protein